MRYLNWDALLFSDDSRVPIQEFKTGCYAVQDHEINQETFMAGEYTDTG